MKTTNKIWTDSELMESLHLFVAMTKNNEPFSAKDPKIIILAKNINRTVGAVCRRMANYTYLAGKGKGLSHCGHNVAMFFNHHYNNILDEAI